MSVWQQADKKESDTQMQTTVSKFKCWYKGTEIITRFENLQLCKGKGTARMINYREKINSCENRMRLVKN